MATTFQNVVDSARVVLQDSEKVRYADSELLEYAIDGVLESRKIRPDFFFGGYKTVTSTYALADDVPLPIMYALYLKDYIVFRAEVRDDEYSSEGRAAVLFNRFKSGLLAL